MAARVVKKSGIRRLPKVSPSRHLLLSVPYSDVQKSMPVKLASLLPFIPIGC